MRVRAHRVIAHLRQQWMGALALFLVLTGGVAYAANTIGSSDVINESLRVDLKNNDILGADIKSNQVYSADVRDDTLTGGGLGTADLKAGSVRTSEVANNSLAGADIDEGTLTGGGDVSGALSNLQIGPDTIGRAELGIDLGLGCCVGSFFEFSVPANDCHIKVFDFDDANLGEVLITFPESQDLGAGVYMRPTVVAHPGEGALEICNSTESDVTIPFGTFFRLRLIE